jgi:hypothetical protein
MKMSKPLTILFGAALLLSSSAFAREANKSDLPPVFGPVIG